MTENRLFLRNVACAALLSALGACTDEEDAYGNSPPDAGTGGLSTTVPVLTPEAGAPLLEAGAGAGPVDAGPSIGNPHPMTPPAAAGLPCDIERLLRARCGTCHGKTPSFGAPMALTSLMDLQAQAATDPRRKVHELVKARINTQNQPMPPPGSTPLTEAERSALNGWLERGVPAGDETCAAPDGGSEPPVAGGEVDVSGLECHKFVAHAEGSKSAKYKVGAAVDEYINMAFAAGWQGVRYGAVMRPVVDNTQAIHHWLVYEEPATDGSIEPGIGQHPNGKLVAGWAPGGPIYDFRKFGDVGLELHGTSYVLELHYNSSDANAEDASGIEICLSKSTPKNIVTYSWLGYDNWLLAGDLEGPRTTWTGTCVPASREPIHILYVTPHMHLAGRHLRSIINEPGGGTRPLHDAAFAFEYQSAYEKNELLMPGETITTTCTFSEPKSFGQGTNDEMCYLFTYAYPKGALTDNGLWGTFAHGEGVCLGQ
jgi:hypothetical protein